MRDHAASRPLHVFAFTDQRQSRRLAGIDALAHAADVARETRAVRVGDIRPDLQRSAFDDRPHRAFLVEDQEEVRQMALLVLREHGYKVLEARNGAEALRILIKVDESLQRRFDFGARSERVARRALAEVEARAK